MGVSQAPSIEKWPILAPSRRWASAPNWVAYGGRGRNGMRKAGTSEANPPLARTHPHSKRIDRLNHWIPPEFLCNVARPRGRPLSPVFDPSAWQRLAVFF